MKHLLILLVCMLPYSAMAAKLADCDTASYDVVVHNAGTEHTVHLTPHSGVIQEYGPVVTFEIPGKSNVTSYQTDEEYCIWNGTIGIQTRSTLSNNHN